MKEFHYARGVVSWQCSLSLTPCGETRVFSVSYFLLRGTWPASLVAQASRFFVREAGVGGGGFKLDSLVLSSRPILSSGAPSSRNKNKRRNAQETCARAPARGSATRHVSTWAERLERKEACV